ncbi:Peroxisomal fatty acid beta-oxidation multifunctional protein AIM1 [Porphyridium purpureum]|uniref:Peroxisomal fatty acid beta-oxidation multifunctional protein AIM1 n=1 Tax=Porphyridium purpureum TaxID=35688 RepID=A0A5J4YTS5_PORPP|nr:Peroxisomal fatty acid beta-oxidation multifunctional protein AIM1 [Porphyridium purpureum]|eukprot:POR4499..scf229_5
MKVESKKVGDGVVVITFAGNAVNALSGRLREAVAAAVRAAEADPSVKAIVLGAEYRRGFFSGGADISEFAAFADGHAPAVGSTDDFDRLENCAKPVVAAVAGTCLGGGLELALCCAARVASKNAAFGLPELKLGIIPGLGGTQRLPRVVGFGAALQMMLASETISATRANELGLMDKLVDRPHDVETAAVAYAEMLAAQPSLRKFSLQRSDKIGSAEKCTQIAEATLQSKDFKKMSSNGSMPQFAGCVRAALHGAQHGGAAGLREEGRIFLECLSGPVSRALIHMFFAQRKQAAPLDLGASAVHPQQQQASAARPIQLVGVIGGGLMGAGIATVMAKAGIRVIIKEIDSNAAEAAHARVKRNLSEKYASALELVSVTTSWDDLSRIDMGIEAVLEDVKLKQEILKTMAQVAPSHCILGTNTSTINIDLVAALIPKEHYVQGRVIGAHFFSPAHLMPLWEIVQTHSTSPEVVKACIQLAKKCKKTPIVVGNCAGFAVNRMYFPQGQAASFAVTGLGVHPYDIDRAMADFGLALGAFKLLDQVGLDVGVAVGSTFDMAFAERTFNDGLLEALLATGRKGQKSGAGFYRYENKSRVPIADAEALEPLIQAARDKQVLARGAKLVSPNLSPSQLVELVLLPCVNEACRILEEKVVNEGSDLDLCSVFGYGFPHYRGGLLHWANEACGGPRGLVDRLRAMHELSGGLPLFAPSHALVRLAYNHCASICYAPRPRRTSGSPDDIVIVGALRTAVGRAYRGGLKDTQPEDLVAPVMARLLRDSGINPDDVDDVVLGMVLPRGDSGVVQTRVAGVFAGLPVTTPVRTINRLCSSGLQAIADAAASIQAGHYNIAMAGGVESMSGAPFTNKDLTMNPRAKEVEHAMDCYLSMGETSENVALRYGVPRDKQDRLAVVSHSRAGNSLLSRKQASEIVPIKTKVVIPPPKDDKAAQPQVRAITVEQDEGIRIGTSLKGMAKLKPVFQKDGTTTAGNSSQLSDGAAMTLLMKRSEARTRGLPIRATFRAFAVVGVDPAVMGIGPAEAIPAVLEKAGLVKEDIDLFEVNEAFGSQAEYCIDVLQLNRDIVNVNGGAIAIGHPLGMTGARLTVSIINELERRGGKYGVVSMCIGTGMGAAAVIEITDDATTSSRL